MDPALEKTSNGATRARERNRQKRMRENRRIRKRELSAFENWIWTELPAYRLGILMGYSFSVYLGISALLAGVPAFNNTAPEGWSFIWAIMLIIGGPLGLVGILYNTPRFRKIELVASFILSWSLSIYASTVLFLAYVADDPVRVTVGAALAWLASGPVVRMFWLISAVYIDIQATKTAGG